MTAKTKKGVVDMISTKPLITVSKVCEMLLGIRI